MIEATDRSISPEMINSAIANAIIAFSVKLNVASLRFQAFRKYGEAKLFSTKMPTATTSSSASQLRRIRCARLVSRSGTWRVCKLASLMM